MNTLTQTSQMPNRPVGFISGEEVQTRFISLEDSRRTTLDLVRDYFGRVLR